MNYVRIRRYEGIWSTRSDEQWLYIRHDGICVHAASSFYTLNSKYAVRHEPQQIYIVSTKPLGVRHKSRVRRLQLYLTIILQLRFYFVNYQPSTLVYSTDQALNLPILQAQHDFPLPLPPSR